MTTNRGSRPSWMWRALAFALVLWVAPRAHAQQAAPEAQVYRFTKDTNIKRCTQDGAAVAGAPPEVADEGWRYYVIGRPAGQLVIQFLPWRTTSKAAADIAAIRAKNAKYRVQAVGAGRGIQRQLRHGTVRVIPADDVVDRQIEAVIGVQVGDGRRVDVPDVHVALERAERTVAHVEDETKDATLVRLLDQIATRGRVWPRVRTRAADDRQFHVGDTTQENCSTD